ncbi:C4-dicarboxylate TRAP transporter substrate-binding protein [Ammoniphilus resinae]|uniref:Tripartite ATP-independent transporter DctP family solute receptor n=1 Tax=Ammoniphilus resinae TaxID=861532 RepID=A0ABS4GW22_9BACL|nr:C4-dicarboxylate TRAP transporter substrate-binding protein [Ammoniphilus resinae]MBP1934451.1 tripartite ATP-independent transporter DctP family solute receptor [Ammoniphilus resinae]
MKKASYLSMLTVLVLSLVTAGCGGSSSSSDQKQDQNTTNNNSSAEKKEEGSQEKYVIKLGTVIADNEPINVYAKKLADKVKERTNGQVEIEVYPNSSLGSNKDTYEQILAGAPVIGHGDTGYWQDYVPDIGVLNGPFLVDSPDDYAKITSSDWYKGISSQMEQKGFKVLALNWYFGERHIISNKEFRKPEDLKGVKLRIPPNVMWKETIAAMGATPTELQWSEVYTGLSSGVVDAAEAPLSTIYGSKLYENAKVISMTGHFKALTGFVIGADYFNSLPADIQQILVEEFQKFGEEESKAAIEQTAEWKTKLEEQGVKFVEDVDVDAFREATKVVYTKFDQWSPGLYDTIQELLKK